MKKYTLIFGLLLSLLLTGCQSEEYSAANAGSPVVSDNNGGESAVSNDDQSKPSTGFQKYDEQISKYADRLPAEYEEGIPDKMIYCVMTDIDKMMITHKTYYTTEEKRAIYTDAEGERHIDIERLFIDDDTEVAFEDGTEASKADLEPGTPVLVESDYKLESNSASLHCTKIVILK